MASGSRGMSNEFDFKTLCATFAEICPDFRNGCGSEEMESLDFANRVIFELGPKMRQLKQSGRDQMWRLAFHGGGSVYIYTYTFQKPISGQPRLGGGKLYLTLKQAGLLAVKKLCDLLPVYHDPRDKILLTPLARVVFDPSNIQRIASGLCTLLGCRVDCSEVLRAVISSCQSDGHHLEHSQSHVALVAVGATTRDAAERKKLRRKTIKQYSKCGKVFDPDQYKIYARFSRMAAPIAAEPPIPDPEPPKEKPPASVRSVSGVLRSIAKAIDDPLSGDTIEMQYKAPPAPKSKEDTVGAMCPSMDVRLEGITLDHVRSIVLKN
ncbi:uncharacterized protein LOC108100181 [Drosophila ficusphila]|uniref:uncharacterized protein LOC108100181 n=1 Tax=Drosophila ficusphila TaxID=30025 RepID=UPI0007E6FA69|nr:uncharacterized protein LOC108100181 [Drosophila ficusphila]XP_017059440.1 uncharacterized protein LOC108100181 [Drosophila ficusphila]XP_043063671.1 uncharacterized protein LOC108100181 [Drosophila ficusphila]